MHRIPVSETYQRIYRVVHRIPRGRVATYGQIAQLAGIPGHARQVGYALHSLPEGRSIAWHRVINAQGEISARSDGRSERLQRALLEREGVEFDDAARISLHRFRWRPQSDRNGLSKPTTTPKAKRAVAR